MLINLKKALSVAAFFAAMVLMTVASNRAHADGLPKGGKVAESSPLIPIAELTKAAPGSWSGIYVGGGFGYQIADTALNLNADAPSYPFSGSLLELDGLSGRGWAYDGRLGVDFQFPGTGIVIGILGGYSGGETEFNVNSDLLDGNVLNLSIQQNWYAGGRIGYAFNKTLVYAGYAWTQGEMSLGIPAAPGVCGADFGPNVSLNCKQDIDGTMIMAGIEAMITPQLSLGAEYTLTQYDTANIFSAKGGGDSIHLDADTDVHAFKVRLNYRPFAK